MYAIHRYIWVETDEKPRRVLSVEVLGTLTQEEYLGFQHAIREERVAELAVVKDGRVECYL